MNTDLKHFSLFERITSVERTPRGLLAIVDSELLHVEVARGDIRGGCLRTDLTLSKRSAQFRLEAKVPGQGYAEFARQEFRLVFHGATPASVRVDAGTVTSSETGFDVPNQDTSFSLEAELTK